MGTYGYAAPEYVMTGEFPFFVDLYFIKFRLHRVIQTLDCKWYLGLLINLEAYQKKTFNWKLLSH